MKWLIYLIVTLFSPEAPPRFSITPEDVIYVNLGDAIILNCQAEGTPTPEIFWYKDANPVEPSGTIGIFNDGTELRIAMIRHEDIGDYTCIARNGEGQISHTARVRIAGKSSITIINLQTPNSRPPRMSIYSSLRSNHVALMNQSGQTTGSHSMMKSKRMSIEGIGVMVGKQCLP